MLKFLVASALVAGVGVTALAARSEAAAQITCGSHFSGYYYERYCMDTQTGYTCAKRWYANGAVWEGCYYSPIA